MNNTVMTIRYDDSEQFYNGIYALVEKGLSFEADHSELKIELNGGH
jgi:hypothetical protein